MAGSFFINVIAMTGGQPMRRAGRCFQDGAEVTMEVLDQDADPPPVKGPNGTPIPDPKRIGRQSFKAIREDRRLKVLADGETRNTLSQAAFDHARRLAADAAAAATELHLENTELREKLHTAEELLRKVDGRIAELEAKLAAVSTAQTQLREEKAAAEDDEPTLPGGAKKKPAK